MLQVAVRFPNLREYHWIEMAFRWWEKCLKRWHIDEEHREKPTDCTRPLRNPKMTCLPSIATTQIRPPFATDQTAHLSAAHICVGTYLCDGNASVPVIACSLAARLSKSTEAGGWWTGNSHDWLISAATFWWAAMPDREARHGFVCFAKTLHVWYLSLNLTLTDETLACVQPILVASFA